MSREETKANSKRMPYFLDYQLWVLRRAWNDTVSFLRAHAPIEVIFSLVYGISAGLLAYLVRADTRDRILISMAIALASTLVAWSAISIFTFLIRWALAPSVLHKELINSLEGLTDRIEGLSAESMEIVFGYPIVYRPPRKVLGVGVPQEDWLIIIPDLRLASNYNRDVDVDIELRVQLVDWPVGYIAPLCTEHIDVTSVVAREDRGLSQLTLPLRIPAKGRAVGNAVFVIPIDLAKDAAPNLASVEKMELWVTDGVTHMWHKQEEVWPSTWLGLDKIDGDAAS